MSDYQLMILVIILLVGVVIILDRSQDRIMKLLISKDAELHQAVAHIMNQDKAIRNLVGFLEEQGYNPKFVENIIMERSNGTKPKGNGKGQGAKPDDNSRG